MNIQSIDIDAETMTGKVTFLDGTTIICKGLEECQKYMEEVRQFMLKDLRYQQQSPIKSA
jgi:hypothetical protein